MRTIEPAKLELGEYISDISNEYQLMVEVHSGGAHRVLASYADIDPLIDERVKFEAILASYIKGVPTVEMAIHDGSYTQAYCLIRQELESLAHMLNLIDEKYIHGKAPNIRRLERYQKIIYSDFTGIAHLSQHDDLASIHSGCLLTDALNSPMHFSFVPRFDEDISKILFAIHYLIVIDVFFCLDAYFKKHIAGVEVREDSKEKILKIYSYLSKTFPDMELPSKSD